MVITSLEHYREVYRERRPYVTLVDYLRENTHHSVKVKQQLKTAGRGEGVGRRGEEEGKKRGRRGEEEGKKRGRRGKKRRGEEKRLIDYQAASLGLINSLINCTEDMPTRVNLRDHFKQMELAKVLRVSQRAEQSDTSCMADACLGVAQEPWQ